MPPEGVDAVLTQLNTMETRVLTAVAQAEGRMRSDIRDLRMEVGDHGERIAAIEANCLAMHTREGRDDDSPKKQVSWGKVGAYGGIGGFLAFVPKIIHEVTEFLKVKGN